MRAALLALLLALPAAAQTPPSGTTYGYPKVDLSQTGTNTNPLKISGTITAVQGNPPWRVTVDTGSVSAFQAGAWSVQALQSGAWHVSIDTGSISVSGSTVTAYGPGGAQLATEATANSLFKAGQSIGNTSFGASQTGVWTVTSIQGGSYTVTPGTGTWPVSAAALPLPAGAATSAKQDQQTAELVAVDSNTAALFKAGQSIGNASFGASQVGSWTVTANQGGAWSVGASQQGSYTVTPGTGTWPVSGTFFQAVQPVSQSGSFAVTPGTGTFPISAASLPLPSGAATSAGQASALAELVAVDSNTAALFKAGQSIGNTQFGASQVGTWTVQQGGAPWSFSQSGSYTVTPGTGTFPISAVSLPLPSGAATSANQTTQINELIAIDSNTGAAFRAGQNIGNTTFGATQSGAWTVTANQGSPPWQFNQAGSFTVTPGTGTWPISAASLPLPVGAATSANQATQTTELVAIDSNTAAAFRAGQSIGNTGFNVNNFPSVQVVAWTSSPTVTAFEGGQWLVATSSAASSVQASQLGAWTVTANQGTSPWNVSQSTVFVQGAQPVGAAPTLNPVSVSGVDGTGLKRAFLTDVAGRISLSSGTLFLGDTGMSIDDAAGTEAQVGWQVGGGSVPASVLATVPPNDILPAAGTIGSLGATYAVTGLHGIGSGFVSVTGSWVGTINIQSSIDGVVWSTNSTSIPGTTAFSQAGITANGSYRIAVVAGQQQVRAIFNAYTSGSATVQFYFSQPVAVPFVFQSIAANLNAQVVGAQAPGNSVATSSPVVVGGADSGNLARSLYVDANGSTREAKDVGRQVVIASATAVAGTTTDTIFTLTVSTAFTNGTSGTSFGIPAGKKFRIQNLNCIWRSAATDGSGTCRLRVSSGGACTATSPLVCVAGGSSLAANAILATNQAAGDHCVIPDGLELSGTQTFCISHLDSGVGMAIDVTLLGYQY